MFHYSVSVREQTVLRHCRDVADILSSIVRPASEKAFSDAVLAAATPSSDCVINSVKMNATFSLSLVTICHIQRHYRRRSK